MLQNFSCACATHIDTNAVAQTMHEDSSCRKMALSRLPSPRHCSHHTLKQKMKMDPKDGVAWAKIVTELLGAEHMDIPIS